MNYQITEAEKALIEDLRTKTQKKKTIDEMFAFYKNADDSTDFANGGWCIQRDEKFYLKLIDAIIEAVKQYEPWILENKPYQGALSREQVMGYSWLGRFLDDSGSGLYKWWGIQANICQTCFREWGQMYYANNCNHTDKKAI